MFCYIILLVIEYTINNKYLTTIIMINPPRTYHFNLKPINLRIVITKKYKFEPNKNKFIYSCTWFKMFLSFDLNVFLLHFVVDVITIKLNFLNWIEFDFSSIINRDDINYENWKTLNKYWRFIEIYLMCSTLLFAEYNL